MNEPIPVVRIGDPDKWRSPTVDTDLPYDFVPVLEGAALQPETPVTHDGANANQLELYSGELRCTLTTLSPLIVGNQQIPISGLSEKVNSEIKKDGCKVPCPEPGVDDKKVIYPLIHKGRVLIPGESLKGMFRQSFGALVSAPLERIGEENHSFRPNAARLSTTGVSRPFAARIVDVESIGGHSRVKKLELLKNLRNLEFVHGKGPTIGNRSVEPGYCFGTNDQFDRKWKIPRNNGFRWVDFPPKAHGGSHSPQNAPRNPSVGDRYLGYHYALDKNWHYLKNANIIDRPKAHPGVIVPASCNTGIHLAVDPAVAWQYIETCQHVSGEAKHGHFSRNGSSPNKLPMPVLAVNDLIFCECLVDAKGNPTRVVMFGHNFMYRWRHLDSITRRAVNFKDSRWAYERRPELSAHQDEKPGANGRAAALSAVRNLLGFVKQQTEPFIDNAYGGLANLVDPFDRLAGRLSFNFALERVGNGESPESRFINAAQRYRVFLHPTVQPKPSCEASYVPGALRGWGDAITLGQRDGNAAYLLQHGTPAFAGRKFYLHQLLRTTSGLAVPNKHYDLAALIQSPPTRLPYEAEELEKFLWGNQTSIASFVSAPGREFGFTVRFKDLRPWELAALAAVLNPDMLAHAIGQGKLHGTKASVDSSPQVSDLPRFGHKLGHGRALGLGSVIIRIEASEDWKTNRPIDLSALIRDCFIGRLNDEVAAQWIKVHRLVPYRVTRPYLLHETAGTAEKITRWSQTERTNLTADGRQKGFDATAPRWAESHPHGKSGSQGKPPWRSGPRR